MIDINRFNAAIALQGSNKKEAARIMGMSYPSLCRKISGESDFYRKEIDAFCEYYKASLVDIFFNHEIEED